MTDEAPPDGRNSILSLRRIIISFGGVRAVNGMSLDLYPGEVLSLIGPNGAGKTTLLNAISGFVTCSGTIELGGRNIARQPAWKRAGSGIGRTFQNVQLFSSLSALDNVVIGGHSRQKSGMLSSVPYWGPARSQDILSRTRALELLTSVGLGQDANRPAASLPFASQKLLGVARALSCSPRILLLDEPAAGLSTDAMERLGALIHRLADAGMAVLLVEHHMELVMSVSDRIVVMHEGTQLAEGRPDFIRTHPEVVAVYLGTGQEPEASANHG